MAKFRIFPHRNLVIVRDTRERLERVDRFMEQFDRAPKQVLIEARFITISQSDLFKLGFSLDKIVLPREGDLIGFGDLAAGPMIETTVEKKGSQTTETSTKTPSRLQCSSTAGRLL